MFNDFVEKSLDIMNNVELDDVEIEDLEDFKTYEDYRKEKIFNKLINFLQNKKSNITRVTKLRNIICFKGKTLANIQSIIKNNIENRTIDKKRINKFTQEFDPEKSGTIILGINYSEKSLYIIDGQHRLHCLFKLQNKKILNSNFVIDLRTIRNNKEYISHLYNENDIFKFNTKDVIKIKIEKVIEEINKHFSSNIFKTNRPYINKEKFSQKLLESIYFKNKETTIEDVSCKILKINIFLLNQDYDTFKSSKPFKLIFKKNIYDKCIKKKLMLGYDISYSYLKLLDTNIINFGSVFKNIYNTQK